MRAVLLVCAVWLVFAVLVWLWRERAIRRALAVLEAPRHLTAVRDLIDRSMEVLLDEYGAETFAKPQLASPPARVPGRPYVETLAQVLAARWEVQVPVITFTVLDPEAARESAGTFLEGVRASVRVGGSGEPPDAVATPSWHIAVAASELGDDLGMAVIVAHEFAHGMLSRDGCRATSVGEDEIRTEVAAALSGFGELMLQNQRRVVRGMRRNTLTWRVGGAGYLRPPALAYVLERHRALLGPL